MHGGQTRQGNDAQRDWIAVLGKIFGDAESLRAPTRRDLPGHEAVKPQRNRHVNHGALAKAKYPYTLVVLVHVNVVLAELLSETISHVLVVELDWWHLAVHGDLVMHRLLAWVVAFEQLGLDDADAAVVEKMLFIFLLDFGVRHWRFGFGVNPPNVSHALRVHKCEGRRRRKMGGEVSQCACAYMRVRARACVLRKSGGRLWQPTQAES